MTGEIIRTKILSVRMIPNADPMMAKALGLGDDERSLGLFTTDCDDVSYAALDEATKKARVRVAYARSMYAGASNASTLLAGEFIGILAGADPAEVRSGIDAAITYIEKDAHFVSANDDGSIVYFSHCISRSGSYLSETASVPEGTPIAYLIAPPIEAMVGLDEALKKADVDLKVFYAPPSETNFAGGLLAGDQAACRAACEAFADAVIRVAGQPIEGDGPVTEGYRGCCEEAGGTFAAKRTPKEGKESSSDRQQSGADAFSDLSADGKKDSNVYGPWEAGGSAGGFSPKPMPMAPLPRDEDNSPVYVDYYTGKKYNEKPENMTHLRANELVCKDHPRIALRGMLDSLQAETIDLMVKTDKCHKSALLSGLSQMLEYERKIMSAEVLDTPLDEITLLGMDSAALRYESHNIPKIYGISHPMPDYRMGEICARLNLLRTKVRETELCAVRAFARGDICERPDIIEALNRLSSFVYILFCREYTGRYNV